MLPHLSDEHEHDPKRDLEPELERKQELGGAAVGSDSGGESEEEETTRPRTDGDLDANHVALSPGGACRGRSLGAVGSVEKLKDE